MSKIATTPSKDIDWTKYHRGPTGKIVTNTPSPMKGKKMPPTKKDIIFAAEYLSNGGNASQAALVSDGSKRMAGYRKQKLTFAMLLDRTGVGDRILARVIKEGLAANKIWSSPTEPDQEIPDHPTRHKFLETALKVKGHMTNIEQQNNIQVNIVDYKENEN